jgi:hypothetical protein
VAAERDRTAALAPFFVLIHIPKSADSVETVENKGENRVFTSWKRVVVGDGFEPSKA